MSTLGTIAMDQGECLECFVLRQVATQLNRDVEVTQYGFGEHFCARYRSGGNLYELVIEAYPDRSMVLIVSKVGASYSLPRRARARCVFCGIPHRVVCALCGTGGR